MLVRALRTGQEFTPDDSRLRELMASGRMHLIRDEGLRALLAGWVQCVERQQNLEWRASDHSRDVTRVTPVWVRSGSDLILVASEGMARFP